MRKQTADFLRLCWGQLRVTDKEWNTEVEFLEWGVNQSEVDARAYDTFLTKLDEGESWNKDNARIVNVMDDSDWNLVQSDAISFREDRV
jgi:hypothetical protein